MNGAFRASGHTAGPAQPLPMNSNQHQTPGGPYEAPVLSPKTLPNVVCRQARVRTCTAYLPMVLSTTSKQH